MCLCLYISVCVCVCVSVPMFSATMRNNASKKRYLQLYRNTGTILKGDLAKNASFRSYAVISFTSAYTQYKYTYNTQLVHVWCLLRTCMYGSYVLATHTDHTH